MVNVKIMFTIFFVFFFSFLAWHCLQKNSLCSYLLPWKRNEKSCLSLKTQQCKAYEIQTIETLYQLCFGDGNQPPSKRNLLLLLQMIHNFRSKGRFVFAELYMQSDLCFLYWYPQIGFQFTATFALLCQMSGERK